VTHLAENDLKVTAAFLVVLAVLLVPSPVVPDEALAQAEEPLEEFVPSEEVSADRSISFPVDI